jgi:hypothetical protein
MRTRGGKGVGIEFARFYIPKFVCVLYDAKGAVLLSFNFLCELERRGSPCNVRLWRHSTQSLYFCHGRDSK